jgi:hypothetical protein
MKPEEAKQKLHELFGSQLFINKEFDDYFSLLKEQMQSDFMDWCGLCKEGKAIGSVPIRKQHKDKFVFFRKIGGDVRAVLIKKQNSLFIELYLTEHREYDDIRKKLGYKQSSYYFS